MKKVLRFLCVLMFISSFVYADGEERIDNGSRIISQERMDQITQQRVEESNSDGNTKEKNEWPNHNYHPPLYLPHGCHNVTGVSALGDSLILEDGSIWKVRAGYNVEALSWREDDPIMIISNNKWFNWFNDYNYKMVNQNTNTYVEVKLHFGPLVDNPYTLQIISMNKSELILSDNSHWKIYRSDSYLLEDWFLEDGVIVGTNFDKKWWSASMDNILINVNMKGNPYIRATQI